LEGTSGTFLAVIHGKVMKCYFYGSNLLPDKLAKNRGLISFAIPDYGVLFRSQYEGNRYECEYAAAIALIRFVQLNQEHFQGKALELLTDSPIVVYQVNNRIATTKTLQRFRDLIFFYKRKLSFELVWVPASMNRASTPVAEIGTNPQSPKFNYDIFDESTKRKIVHKPQNKSHIKVA
jgi:hypothetical protein